MSSFLTKKLIYQINKFPFVIVSSKKLFYWRIKPSYNWYSVITNDTEIHCLTSKLLSKTHYLIFNNYIQYNKHNSSQKWAVSNNPNNLYWILIDPFQWIINQKQWEFNQIDPSKLIIQLETLILILNAHCITINKI